VASALSSKKSGLGFGLENAGLGPIPVRYVRMPETYPLNNCRVSDSRLRTCRRRQALIDNVEERAYLPEAKIML